MTYSAHRPKKYQGRGDSHLPQVVRYLRRVLSDMQRDFAYDSLRLRSAALNELAGILVDFAEDIHNSTGIILPAKHIASRKHAQYFAQHPAVGPKAAGFTDRTPDRRA